MENNIKQTAVEWLIKEYHLPIDSPLVQQAKEMQKQQMIEFGILVWNDCFFKEKKTKPKDIYNQIYGGNK